MTMNLLHLLMKVMRLMVTHLMVKGVKPEERMVKEILHQTLHQLKVCDILIYCTVHVGVHVLQCCIHSCCVPVCAS